MRVGIVGTGEMGRPLVDRMLGAGIEVVAFARRPQSRADLAAAGASCVDAVADLAPASDVVIVYVHTDEQVRDVVFGDGLADAMEPGSVILVLTTGSPNTVTDIAARVAGRDVGVVDAPGSGGPAQVAAGSLTLLVGGRDEHVARCEPVFASYASRVVHLGPVGAGQRVKLLNNVLLGAHLELAVEAARVGQELGMDPAELARTLHTCSGQSFALDLLASMGSAGAVVRSAGPYVHKDVVVARGVATELGIDLGTLATVTDPFLARTR